MNAPWDDWKAAEADLRLDIEAPVEIILSDGRKFIGDFLLKDFGGRSGTIVIQDYKRFADYSEEVEKLGYGFSTLEPAGSESYHRQVFAEMFKRMGLDG